MNILSLDSSSWALAVGLTEGEHLLGEMNTLQKKNHSLRLMPAVEQLLVQLALEPAYVQAIAVGYGPGSYTGVRIGVTTAKSLAWSLNIPLVGLSSLHIMAQNNVHFSGLIWPLIDARRNQVYAGCYQYHQDQQVTVQIREDELLSIDTLLEQVKQTQGPCLFMGTGARLHETTIQQQLGERAVLAPLEQDYPRGSVMGLLAWRLFFKHEQLSPSIRAIGQQDHIHHFVPQYLQLAEAEKKWLAKQNG